MDLFSLEHPSRPIRLTGAKHGLQETPLTKRTPATSPYGCRYENEVRYDDKIIRLETGDTELEVGEARNYSINQPYGLNSVGQRGEVKSPAGNWYYTWGDVNDQEHTMSLYLVRTHPLTLLKNSYLISEAGILLQRKV